nr:dTDP-glucose 4,6-dehydratase [Plesiomonas shigelloides]
MNVYTLTYAGNLENFSEVSNSSCHNFEYVNICNRAELDRVFDEFQPDVIMH